MSMTKWISADERFPEKGEKVLVWCCGENEGYGLDSLDEQGFWVEMKSVTHWMELPEPPSMVQRAVPETDIRVEITDDRLMIDIDEDKETFAVLMQCYINGNVAGINGESFFVVDMKNEMINDKMVAVFYLRPEIPS